MKPLQWLELATDREGWRPKLSYAYQTELLGEPVTLAADGYRMHWLKGHLVEGGNPIISFKKSCGAEGEPEAWYENLSSNITPLIEQTVFAHLSVNAYGLYRAVKCAVPFAKNNVLRLWYDPAGILHVFNQGIWQGDCDTALPVRPVGWERATPFRACFNAHYLLHALKLFHGSKPTRTRVELLFSRAEAGAMAGSPALILGQPGRALALVMGMIVSDSSSALAWWLRLPAQ